MNQNGSINSPTNPATADSIVTMNSTEEGIDQWPTGSARFGRDSSRNSSPFRAKPFATNGNRKRAERNLLVLF